MNSVFITGATGLVGSFLCEKLLEEGYTIYALKRKKSDLGLLQGIHEKINWVEGDILDIVGLEAALKDINVVIHCAAMVSFLKKDHKKMYQINVEGFHWCEANP